MKKWSKLSDRERLVLKMRYGLYSGENTHNGDCQTTSEYSRLMYRVLKKAQLKNSGKYSDDFLMFCSGALFSAAAQR